MKFTFSEEESILTQALEEIKRELDEARAGAVKDAAALAVKEGQANVVAAGFSTRRKVRSLFYPNVGSNPAALIYFAAPFAPVFEQGITIRGRPLLWVPIEHNLPAGIHSPSQYGRKLVSVNIAGKRPLLFDAQDRLRGPLFFGIKRVTIRKRLDLRRIFARAVEHMHEFYEQRIKS